MSETITDGTVVTMHYTLKNPEGEILDSSAGDKPLAYLHGADNIVPGLERQLAGKGVGDTVSAVVPPEEAYGVRQGAPQRVPRAAFPDDADLAPGMQIVAQQEDGSSFALWILQTSDEEVVVDGNHPLAGVTLHFDVEITALREASAEEMEHGHPHGPGGHDH